MLHKLSQLFQKSTKTRHRHHLNEKSSQFTQQVITSTCFWRNPPQLQTIFEQLLPKLQTAKPQTLRLGVHAGSIGCEAISLQMASNYYQFPHPIEIVSTEIDSKAVQKARRGKFEPQHFLEPGSADHTLLPPELIEQFTKRACFNKIQIKQNLLKQIKFEQCDLASRSATLQFGQFDLIFFQNAIVHINPDAAQQCVANLIETANPNSLIFLGGTAGDQLSRLAHQFNLLPLNANNEMVYNGWSWRQNIWGQFPSSHLGMEPFDAQHADAQYRYAHVFALETGRDFWQPFIDNESVAQ